MPPALPEALYLPDGDLLVPTELARGPWSPDAQHGGPPSALVARAVESADAPGPMVVARLTIELWRPVPLRPLRVRTEILRPGKKVQWVGVGIEADGVEVVRATALRMRRGEVDVRGAVVPSAEPLPPPDEQGHNLLGSGWEALGFWHAVESRVVRGGLMQPGPAAAWFRVKVPIVAGEEATPLQHLAAIADMGSGVGAPVTFLTHIGINPDLSITLHREPVAGWFALESHGWAHEVGVGMAEAWVWDALGPVGRTVQTLLVDARPEPMADPGAAS